MNFTDYASLQTAIGDELNRTDLTTAIPGFISLMESQTERQLSVREMLASVQFTVDSEFEDLPDSFLETRSFYLNTTPITPLLFRTIESLEMFKRANSGVGKPTDYTVLGEQFMFVKTPDTSYTATLVYYQNIPRLTDVVTTNWLLTKHPDIYFYGSLLNSAPYLKEDARIQVWAQLYQNAVEALKVADERSQTAASGLKSQARMF
jgi:hypothetical protein